MWKYIKQYKYHNLGVAALMLLGNLGVLSAILLGFKVTKYILNGDFRPMLTAGLMTVGVYLILVCMVFPLQEICKGRVIALMNQEVRADLNAKLIGKNYEEFCAGESGEYISWYTNDIREAEQQGFLNVYECLDSVIKLLLGVTAITSINMWMLAVTLMISGGLLVVSKYLKGKIEKSSGKMSHALERFTEVVKEQIGGFAVLKYFGKLENFGRAIGSASEKMEQERCTYLKRRDKSTTQLSMLNAAGNVISNAVLLGMCALRIVPVEIFMGGGVLMDWVKGSLSGLAEYRVILAGAKPYFDKAKAEKAIGEKKEELPVLRKDIRIEDLSFAYTDTPVLSGLNMEFKIGGKYAIVGKSGCGKSTLLKILLGQLTGYEGKLLFDGKEAKRYGEDSFYDQMAYIEQNVFLFNTTIRENITLGDTFTEQEIEEALTKSALIRDMDHFAKGLDTFVGENGNQLSGGQKQRIAIARALIHKRSILIVDEGTSALDRENAEAIEDSLLKCEDLTLILVSHHLMEEKKHAYTEVWQMENGAARRSLCGAI